MLLIHTPVITPRTEYVFSHMLGTVLGLGWQLTSDRQAWEAFGGPKCTYGGQPAENIPHFASAGLLESTGLDETPDPGPAVRDGQPSLFGISGGCLPFDPFSAGFWMLSRYEEWLPFEEDPWHRFPPEASLAGRHGWTGRPLVDEWALQVWEKLKARYPRLERKKPAYRFLPTVDVDMAWAYRHKGFWRNAGGLARDLLRGSAADAVQRLKVLLRLVGDPFFTFPYLEQLEKETGLKHLYFILIGDYGRYDKNISHRKQAFRALIRQLDRQASTGLHPSLGTWQNPARLSREAARLEAITGRAPARSRQHYLLIRFPDTPRALLANEIREDYSLGYTSAMGFRSGTSHPHPWFDLEHNRTENLTLYPLNIMDASLQYYLKLTPEQAPDACRPVIEQVKKHGGTLVTLFHNNSLSEQKEWTGWRKVYEQIILQAAS